MVTCSCFVFLMGFLLLLLLPAMPVESACGGGRQPVVFNFGDSNSDTGGYCAALGVLVRHPEGRVFFHRPSGRFCDGRLVIDFLRECLNASYLSPYMESLGADFSGGANFAIAGSSTLPPNVPFALAIQVQQFLLFNSRSLELIAQGEMGPIDAEGFKNALYVIDIGQNDLSGAFFANLSYAQVVEKIPAIVSEIKKAIEASSYYVQINVDSFIIDNLISVDSRNVPLNLLMLDVFQKKSYMYDPPLHHRSSIE